MPVPQFGAGSKNTLTFLEDVFIAEDFDDGFQQFDSKP